MITRLLVALVLGAIAYFLAQLFLNHLVSSLVGILVALIYFFGDSQRTRV